MKKMIKLVHYSKDPDFALNESESAKRFDAGCYFYLAGKEVEWSDRNPFYFLAPEGIVEQVQSFEPGEFGNKNEVVEVIVRPKNLKLLVPIY